MLPRFSIFYKLLICVTILFLIVGTLSISGIRSISSYRSLARTVSDRAAEQPLANKLIASVDELRFKFSQIQPKPKMGAHVDFQDLEREAFCNSFDAVTLALRSYGKQLEQLDPNGTGIGDNRDERATVAEIDRRLDVINKLNSDQDWILGQFRTAELGEELEELHKFANELPNYLQTRMMELKGNVRGQYHTLIAVTWTTSILSTISLVVLMVLIYLWVFRPLNTLIQGSRKVAAGNFDHRITLETDDEMAELARAMNQMTSRFQEIRDDLDRQVKQRTKEVVRSEQLASVGFLAAGVAHEINNPLASIAWCAESLESRMHDIIYDEGAEPDESHDAEIGVLRTYLRRMQDEAFRCKRITEKLLDFSRLGDIEKLDTNLRELTTDVIEMVQTLGRYRKKRIEFDCHDVVIACVNAQEIKQVLLNLITNALDSLDPDGIVWVKLSANGSQAELSVADNGAGMTPEVLEHLFEPFFTRRRGGQGTGLGLSISYRIVADHDGKIEASSKGPGKGSQFRLTLPLVQREEKYEKQIRAA
ncbi:MAG: HAMP domain-containing sensor histidine kinase [Pirellulaceae bacterium]|nr:HAMP domain-containing sensor histidine kinase [Pirellulaceae bacterium]